MKKVIFAVLAVAIVFGAYFGVKQIDNSKQLADGITTVTPYSSPGGGGGIGGEIAP